MHHPPKAELVKLRYFVELTLEEAAEVMGISAPTATRYWAFARAWLFRKISRQNGVLGLTRGEDAVREPSHPDTEH